MQSHTVHYMHLFGLSPLCISKCIPKVSARVDAKSYWLHLINFLPLQVFQCYLKLLTSELPKSQHSQVLQGSPGPTSDKKRKNTNRSIYLSVQHKKAL